MNFEKMFVSFILILTITLMTPVAVCDMGDTHNIIDEVGSSFIILIGQKLNFTGEIPPGVPIIGISGDLNGNVYGITSNNYNSGAFMSEGGIYWIDADYDGRGGDTTGYDWQDDDDAYLYVSEPYVNLDLKVQWKSVKNIQQGTNLIIDFVTNLANTDTVDIKVTDPNGTLLTVNPTNPTQIFNDINVSYLHSHYGSQGITTDGWPLGNYTFQVVTVPTMARGLDACSSSKSLEICKQAITIQADKTNVSPFEIVHLTIKGAQFHEITLDSSNHEQTIFPPRLNDNPYFPPTLPFIDTLRSENGVKNYVVYFERPGVYTLNVSDIDAGLDDSIGITVTDEEYIHIGITKGGYPDYLAWVSEIEQVNLSVIGKPNHKVRIITSCPSKTDFELGLYDYTTTSQNLDSFVEGIWENGITDSIDGDGEREYRLHFKKAGGYKMTVYDSNATIGDWVNISVSYYNTKDEKNPERMQDAWTLSTVFIGELLNLTGLEPGSIVVLEKTTEPFDSYGLSVNFDGCAKMDYTNFVDPGIYNMTYVRQGQSWEKRENRVVYFIEPKLTIDVKDSEGSKIESFEQGQSLMIDTSSTILPEDDILAIEVEGNNCRWIENELSLSELSVFQIDTMCWMPGIYSIKAKTIEEQSRGLIIYSNWVYVEIHPKTDIISPTAFIDSITPNPAEQGKDTISFIGRGNDPDGMVLAYNWRSSMDGNLNTSSTFTKPASELSVGTHTIYFKVMDNDGAWSSEDSEILTIKAANQPPIASFTYSPLNPGINELVTFNASSSLDPDGNITSYNWSFGDGNATITTEVFVTHSYSSAGNYNVTLTVIDDKGATNITSREVLVCLKPPIAIFSYSPPNPVVNETLTFNASESYDPNGFIDSYQFEFGDGTNGTGEVVTYGYSSAGTYTVNLTVTDTEGATNRTSQTIKVFTNISYFDTEPGTYPSISGTHNGTITMTHTVNVSKIYIYPCTGTGGHIKYARIWNASWDGAEANWNGYVDDCHNLLFDKNFTLVAGEKYNYTIRTGSYPQIHHTAELLTAKGWITCTSFIDTNSKRHEDWIPAIRLS